MKVNSGQALVELALCAPVVILLTLGTAAVVQVEDAAAGLDAATHAAATAAARAPDPVTANTAARSTFEAAVASYPLSGTTVQISVGGFGRSTNVIVSSEGFVDVGWAPLLLPHRLGLHSRAVIGLERWRTHRPSP
ncbi:MAG TPA: TadE/TadG family type IV pilus assembly protein [Streptosporangiaceae bacterium]|nr:TadE/TadG family type IV pilus assembly protein [Streptosporangiaceae bacterium]